MVRTIAEFMEQRKTSYRLISNAYIRNGSSMYKVLSEAGQGQHHFSTLLFTLGRGIPDTYLTIEDLYSMVVNSYSGENAIFYVAPFENEKRSELVKRLKERLGCQIYPIYANKKPEGKFKKPEDTFNKPEDQIKKPEDMFDELKEKQDVS
jgi:hypothetical protein